MVDLAELESIARGEFADIVLDVYRIDAKLRILLVEAVRAFLAFCREVIQVGTLHH